MGVRLGADAMSSDPNWLRANGITFISRYLSDFPSKNLTLAEAQRLSDAGIDVVSNWENDINDWQGGYSAGYRNATVAWHQHKACGGPDGRPVYFSIDTDVDPNNATLHEYFRGLGAGMTPGQIGVYASTGVCRALKAAGLVHWTWRTMSTGWSGGQGSPSEFNVEQTGYLAGSNGQYDRDASITDDFGQWRVGAAPLPTQGDDLPTPQDVWAYKGASDAEDMRQYLVDAVAALKGLPQSVWAYSNGDVPDVHQTLDSILSVVNDMKAEVASLKTGGVDINALAIALAAHLKLAAQ